MGWRARGACFFISLLARLWLSSTWNTLQSKHQPPPALFPLPTPQAHSLPARGAEAPPRRVWLGRRAGGPGRGRAAARAAVTVYAFTRRILVFVCFGLASVLFLAPNINSKTREPFCNRWGVCCAQPLFRSSAAGAPHHPILSEPPPRTAAPTGRPAASAPPGTRPTRSAAARPPSKQTSGT